MASGLNLATGLRFRASAAQSTPTPDTGTVNYAAFQPGKTQQMQAQGIGALTPGSATGMCFWVGVGALALLILIRQSLPR